MATYLTNGLSLVRCGKFQVTEHVRISVADGRPGDYYSRQKNKVPCCQNQFLVV